MKEKFRFKKEMGQNFISDPALIERLAEVAQVTREDGVLEIGPGRGALTCALARRCRRLIAVELDRTLLDGLETTLALYPNAEVVEGDILRADLPALVARLGVPCRVAANLPYNITTPVVEKLLRARLPFASLAIMVQKEVGDKMTAGPGEAGYGPFSLLVQYFAEAREVLRVDASCFTPRPRVDSSFMLLAPREAPPVAVRDEAMLRRTIRASFAMRRKTLLNNVMAGFSLSRPTAQAALESAGVRPDARAEQASLEQFARLADALSEG